MFSDSLFCFWVLGWPAPLSSLDGVLWFCRETLRIPPKKKGHGVPGQSVPGHQKGQCAYPLLSFTQKGFMSCLNYVKPPSDALTEGFLALTSSDMSTGVFFYKYFRAFVIYV